MGMQTAGMSCPISSKVKLWLSRTTVDDSLEGNCELVFCSNLKLPSLFLIHMQQNSFYLTPWAGLEKQPVSFSGFIYGLQPDYAAGLIFHTLGQP